MTSLPVDLLKRLNRTLMECDQFRSDATLRPLFRENRISLWRDGLPETSSVQDRVSSMITHLLPKYNADDENGLVLFLQLLTEWHDPQDRMHHTLQALATEVAEALAVPPEPDAPSPPKKQSWGWVLGGLALLLGLIGGWGLWMANQLPLPPTVVSGTGDAEATRTAHPPTPTTVIRPTTLIVTMTQTATPRPPTPVGMVLVPAGEFTMGSHAEVGLQACEQFFEGCLRSSYEDEVPERTVYLDAFYMDMYEVTQTQYANFLNVEGNQAAGGVSWVDVGRPDSLITAQNGQFAPQAGFAEHPVIYVSWYGAQAYCEGAEKRLPTEAEWEKAARGTDGRQYPWGNEFTGSEVNFCDKNCPEDWKLAPYDDGHERTAPVGSYPLGQSPYGVYDMGGNVWEWAADCYEADYYSRSGVKNPLNNSCSVSGNRVVRGGSWANLVTSARAPSRHYHDPSDRNINIGFRCAVSP